MWEIRLVISLLQESRHIRRCGLLAETVELDKLLELRPDRIFYGVQELGDWLSGKS